MLGIMGPRAAGTKEIYLRYGVAACSIIGGVAVRAALATWLGATVPYITFFPAVMFAAWFGGMGPLILATALSLVAVFSLLIPAPAASANLVGALVFLGVSILMSALNEALRRCEIIEKRAA
jgi:hypothetical protein